MPSKAEGSGKTDAVERFKALFDAAEGRSTAPPRASVGVTECGRYGYRYDDEGRFYAVLLPGARAELPDRWKLRLDTDAPRPTT